MSLNVPPEMAAGVFADFAAVWSNEHGFTIDFVAPSAPPGTDENGNLVQPAVLVSRVRVPPTVIFQLARAISDSVAKYEETHGKIAAFGPSHPPEEVQ